MENENKKFPEGMVPIGNEHFKFDCHPGVSCFTVCCKNVDLTLYPYDVLKLKKGLGMDSEDFMREYTFLLKGDNPFFPTVKLKLLDDDKKCCPFLKDEGCRVYDFRPSACRTYPLERAVDRSGISGMTDEYFFMTHHPYCMGHNETKEFGVKSWTRNQKLIEFNTMNSFWAELDTLFSTNPWKGEGAGGEKQRVAFMVCYNIDGFRRFTQAHNLIKLFQIDKDFRRRIDKEDSELLKFGFEWLKLLLGGKSSLIQK